MNKCESYRYADFDFAHSKSNHNSTHIHLAQSSTWDSIRVPSVKREKERRNQNAVAELNRQTKSKPSKLFMNKYIYVRVYNIYSESGLVF